MSNESTPHGGTPVLEKTTYYTYRERTIPLHRIIPDTLRRIWNRSPVDSLAHRNSQVPLATLLSQQALTPAPAPVELDQARINSRYPVVTPYGDNVLIDGGDGSEPRAQMTFAIPQRRRRVGTLASLVASGLLFVGSVAGSVQKNQPSGNIDLAGQTIPEDKGISGHASLRQRQPNQAGCIDVCLLCLTGQGTLDEAGICTCSNGSVIPPVEKNACKAGPGSNSSGSGIPTETNSHGQVSPECPRPGDYAYMDGKGEMHYCGSRTDPNSNTTAIATATATPLPTPTPNAPPTNNQTRSEEAQHPTSDPSSMDSYDWEKAFDRLQLGFGGLGIVAVLAVSGFVLNQLGIFRFAKRLLNEGPEGIARTSIEGTIRNNTASSGQYQLDNLPTDQERYDATKNLSWFQKLFGKKHIKQLKTNRKNEWAWNTKNWDALEEALNKREKEV